jgi:hypothetical protein
MNPESALHTRGGMRSPRALAMACCGSLGTPDTVSDNAIAIRISIVSELQGAIVRRNA